MHNDKAHQKAAKGSSGVVGESHIWDGPLSQEGRLHGQGSSLGITGGGFKSSNNVQIWTYYSIS